MAGPSDYTPRIQPFVPSFNADIPSVSDYLLVPPGTVPPPGTPDITWAEATIGTEYSIAGWRGALVIVSIYPAVGRIAFCKSLSDMNSNIGTSAGYSKVKPFLIVEANGNSLSSTITVPNINEVDGIGNKNATLESHVFDPNKIGRSFIIGELPTSDGTNAALYYIYVTRIW